MHRIRINRRAIGNVLVLWIIVSCTVWLQADEADYWRAKSAALIAISKGSSTSPGRPRAAQSAVGSELKRPVVYRMHAKWCIPCRNVALMLTPEVRRKLPFDIVDWDVDAKGWMGASQIPGFWWESSGGKLRCNWNGVDDLVSRWKVSQKANGRMRYRVRSSNWTGPDGVHQFASREEAVSHLLNDPQHRGQFTLLQLESLTLDELKALHSDHHEGQVRWAEMSTE